jgi:uncharacterized protein YecE (DUF72 family)
LRACRNDDGRETLMPARILVGSCSWTDPTLIASGRFYPAGVSSAETRLRYYAERFPIVEVDSTYYAPPTTRNSALWAARTPDDFVFNVKAYALLTGHPARVDRLPAWIGNTLSGQLRAKDSVYLKDLDAATSERVWSSHREALEPLAAAGKLGAVLFQFPPWFRRCREHADYLLTLPQRFPGWPLAVEFRGGGWMDGAAASGTLRLLEEAGLTYVNVDEPQGFRSSTPATTAATTSLAIVRLHGRNAETWDARTRVASDRFRYLYSDDELDEWVPRIRELTRQTASVHVLFNNNYEDWGIRNARRMAHLLRVGRQPPQGQLELS